MSSPCAQFVILAKGKTNESLLNQVITNATQAENVFAFSELLSMPNIQALNNPSLRLLEIFAYGSYSDYKTKRSELSLPELNEKQTTKLKQLTLITMARINRVISYNDLQRELDIAETRVLEDLIIHCIYAGVLQGQLDQRQKCLHVDSVAGRDVRLEEIDEMVAVLNAWKGRAEDLVQVIDEKGDAAHRTLQERIDHETAVQQEIEKVTKQVEAKIARDGDFARSAQMSVMEGGGGALIGAMLGMGGERERKGPGGRRRRK